MLTQSEFIARVDAYLAATGMSASKFGKEAVGDPNFVGDLKGGREPRTKTRDRALAFMEANPAAEMPAEATA